MQRRANRLRIGPPAHREERANSALSDELKISWSPTVHLQLPSVRDQTLSRTIASRTTGRYTSETFMTRCAAALVGSPSTRRTQ